MTEKNTQVESVEEPADSVKKASNHEAANSTPKASTQSSNTIKRLITLFSITLFLLVFVACGYWGWRWIQQKNLFMQELQAQVSMQNDTLQNLTADLQNYKQSGRQLDRQRREEFGAQMNAVEQRLASHNKRLLSLSSTDRDDWRLAEAEYLLQLANQRLVIERDSRNAEALLSAADAILRDLADIDLFPVRQSINRDLTALKLAGTVDREGIFLRLAALSEEIEALPLLPKPQIGAADNLIASTDSETEVETPASWLGVVKASFWQALNRASDYIRVRNHDRALEPLLPPESHLYLQQNFRFTLERAQLALLRGEPAIYQKSLAQARSWLNRYYSLVEQTPRFDAELAALQGLNVTRKLPDISTSLEELQGYIEKLHKLADVEAPAKPESPRPEQQKIHEPQNVQETKNTEQEPML
jgi:uroporphyrin-III C-methyltransferase